MSNQTRYEIHLMKSVMKSVHDGFGSGRYWKTKHEIAVPQTKPPSSAVHKNRRTLSNVIEQTGCMVCLVIDLKSYVIFSIFNKLLLLCLL